MKAKHAFSHAGAGRGCGHTRRLGRRAGGRGRNGLRTLVRWGFGRTLARLSRSSPPLRRCQPHGERVAGSMTMRTLARRPHTHARTAGAWGYPPRGPRAHSRATGPVACHSRILVRFATHTHTHLVRVPERHTHTRTSIRTMKPAHIHIRTYSRASTHTHTYTRGFARTHTHIHTRTPIRTTHTHTHTHWLSHDTHTHSLVRASHEARTGFR
jgi:hypothetical protein